MTGRPVNLTRSSNSYSLSSLLSNCKMDHELRIFEGNHSTKCLICNTTGLLLCCDYCPNAYHPSCLNPCLKERPREYWQCPQCEEDCINQNIQAIIDRREEFNELHPSPIPTSTFVSPETMDPFLNIPYTPSPTRTRNRRKGKRRRDIRLSIVECRMEIEC